MAPKESEKKSSSRVLSTLVERQDAQQNRMLALQQEVEDAHREVGALLIANRRIERMVNALAERLSKYEDVNTGEPVEGATSGAN